MGSGSLYTNNFVSVYAAALTIKIFGFDPFNPWVVRLPGVLFGTLLIYCVYALARALFSRADVSLASAFIVAFLYYEIAWSRQARGYAALAVFIVLTTLFLWKYFESRRRSDLALTMVFFILAALSHWVALAFLPAFVLMLHDRPRSFILQSKKRVAYLIFVILVGYISILLALDMWVMLPRYVLFPFLPLWTVLAVYMCMKVVDLTLANRLPKRVRSLIAFLILVSVVAPFYNFIPRKAYAINLVSPQPDYNGAYGLIHQIMRPDDVIISIHPALANLYLGRYGLWIPAQSMSEREADFYSGVNPIRTLEQLKGIIENSHGFIVIDGYVFKMLRNNRMHYIVDNSRIRLLFYSHGSSPSGQIWVYRF